MRAAPIAVCALVALALAGLTVSTADCSSCGGAPCSQSFFSINAATCIAAVQSDCLSSGINHPCNDAGGGGSFVAILAPADGGTCNVSTTLGDGTTIAVQVHWQLLTPA